MFKLAVFALALSASCAFAQSGKVELTTPPPLADGVDAFPKLIGDSPIFVGEGRSEHSPRRHGKQFVKYFTIFSSAPCHHLPCSLF